MSLQQEHQSLHLLPWAAPVIGRERIRRERRDSRFGGSLDNAAKGAFAGVMPGKARESTALGPAAIAVHDYCQMKSTFHNKVLGQKILLPVNSKLTAAHFSRIA